MALKNWKSVLERLCTLEWLQKTLLMEPEILRKKRVLNKKLHKWLQLV